MSYERLLKEIKDYPSEGGQDAPIDRLVLIKMIEEAELSWVVYATTRHLGTREEQCNALDVELSILTPW